MKGNGHSTDELIRLEAYLLSEKEGHPHGKERIFWVQAEAIVHGRMAAPKVAKKTVKAPAAKAVEAPAKAPAVKKAPAAKKTAEKQLPPVSVAPTPAPAKPAAKKATKPAAPAAPKAKAPAKAASKSK